MPGGKNLKYSNATNQTQQFVEEILQKASKNLPPGAKFGASTWIKGSVILDEDAKRDVSGALSAVKELVGSGSLKVDAELIKNLVGDADFRVEASIEWDRTEDKAQPKK